MSNRNISRRDFLGYSLGTMGIVLAGSLESFDYSKGLTSANRFLRDFPENIPGAASVRKYETPGAAQTLVHIRQKHYPGEKLASIIDSFYEVDESKKADNLGESYDYLTNGTSMPLISKEAEKKLAEILKKFLYLKICTEVDNCQKDIYDILKFLKREGMGSEVYSEGACIDSNQNYTEASAIYYVTRLKDMMENLTLEGKLIFELPNQKSLTLEASLTKNLILDPNLVSRDLTPLNTEDWFKGLSDGKFAKILKKFKYAPGADLLLAMDREYSLLPCEQVSLAIASCEALADKNLPEEELIRRVYEDREDKVLEIISIGKKEYAICTFGASHAFGGLCSFKDYELGNRTSQKDNIAHWNRKNPKKKFSLIEIVPVHLIIQ